MDSPWYNGDALSLVASNHKYGDRSPVQINIQVIDHLVTAMTEKELQQAWGTWKQVHLSIIISKRNIVKGP